MTSRSARIVIAALIVMGCPGRAVAQLSELDNGIQRRVNSATPTKAKLKEYKAEPWWSATINARAARKLAAGTGVTVAIIDTGVDLDHPALRGQLRTDGYNFGDCAPERSPSCDPGSSPSPFDKLGHGTFVTGIIAAKDTQNPHGYGLATEAKILPIKVNPGMMDDFTAESLAKGITYAKNRGARIINLSLDMPDISGHDRTLVENALRDALNAGVFIVVASGNRARDVSFPANHPGVIAVAGIDSSGTIDRRSNHGHSVAIAAPSENIESTILGGGFGRRGGGTSFAAPFVSATLASMLQLKPDLTFSQAKRILCNSATPIKGEENARCGMLNAGKALERTAQAKGL